MAGPVNVTLLFDVGDIVYHISETDGVREAVVKSGQYVENTSGTATEYSIQFTNTTFGSLSAVDEADLDSDVDVALATYKSRYLV